MHNLLFFLACCLTSCLVCMAPQSPTIPSSIRARPCYDRLQLLTPF